jgi:DNA-binding NtrC family response regulator
VNRILLIDDDVGAQLLYRSRLTDLGYQVVVASTGAMGLMEARSSSFDLFLVDIGLGSGIDGFEVCRRLKTIPEIHGVPVVLISGQVKTQEDLHRGYEAGCQAFLVKGDLMLLEDVVRAMLRIKSLQDDLALQNRLLEERHRRFEAESARNADLERALSNSLGHAQNVRGRPDGLLLVQGNGEVFASDRGARDLFGQVLDGKHLALLAPESTLEAAVRNTRTEPNDAIRFELPERPGRAARLLHASVHPFVSAQGPQGTLTRLVLLYEANRQRVSPTRRDEALMRREWAGLVEAARETFRPGALIGPSTTMREFRAQVARAARAEGPVLIQAPGGAGKSLVARILHFSSERSGPYLVVDCSPHSAQELEAELFGSVKGPEGEEPCGALHQARGGTLVLRDVERLDPTLQARVLEALVHGRVRRQGATTDEPCEARIVGTTSADLSRCVAQGAFHGSLAERLTEIELCIPSFAARPGDLEALVRHFLERHGRMAETRISQEALHALVTHDWQENVRRLEQVVQAACEAVDGEELGLADIPQSLLASQEAANTAVPAASAKRQRKEAYLARELDELLASLDSTVSLLDSYEKGALLHALRLVQGDKLAAARLLKVGKSTLYRKLKQHGIA